MMNYFFLSVFDQFLMGLFKADAPSKLIYVITHYIALTKDLTTFGKEGSLSPWCSRATVRQQTLNLTVSPRNTFMNAPEQIYNKLLLNCAPLQSFGICSS